MRLDESVSVSMPASYTLKICVPMYMSGTHQFLFFHALHKNDKQMLSLCAAVGERLLDGHQQLVSQRLINYAAKAERCGGEREYQRHQRS